MITVAFQGERGAFSEDAAQKLLGTEISVLPLNTFEDLFVAVQKGNAHFAVLPIENSIVGTLYQNVVLLRESGAKVFGEVELKIVQNLVAHPEASFVELSNIYSHPVALAQCRKFFSQNKNLQIIEANDTAGSVRKIMASENLFEAAIASSNAARVYGAKILIEGIQDKNDNITRFLLVGMKDIRS